MTRDEMEREAAALLLEERRYRRLGIEMPPDDRQRLKSLLQRLGYTRMSRRSVVKRYAARPRKPRHIRYTYEPRGEYGGVVVNAWEPKYHEGSSAWRWTKTPWENAHNEDHAKEKFPQSVPEGHTDYGPAVIENGERWGRGLTNDEMTEMFTTAGEGGHAPSAEDTLGRSNEVTPEDFYMSRRSAVRRYALDIHETIRQGVENSRRRGDARDYTHDTTAGKVLGDALDESGEPHAPFYRNLVPRGNYGYFPVESGHFYTPYLGNEPSPLRHSVGDAGGQTRWEFREAIGRDDAPPAVMSYRVTNNGGSVRNVTHTAVLHAPALREWASHPKVGPSLRAALLNAADHLEGQERPGEGPPGPDTVDHNAARLTRREVSEGGAPLVVSYARITVSPPRPEVGFRGETVNHHDLVDEGGNAVGRVKVTPRNDGKHLHIGWIGAGDQNTGNVLGAEAMRTALASLRTHYPDAEYVSGIRTSGFRSPGGDANEVDVTKPVERTVVALPRRRALSRRGTGTPVVRMAKAEKDRHPAHPLIAGFPLEHSLRAMANDASRSDSVRHLAKHALTTGDTSALWGLHDAVQEDGKGVPGGYNLMSAADKIHLDAHTHHALRSMAEEWKIGVPVEHHGDWSYTPEHVAAVARRGFGGEKKRNDQYARADRRRLDTLRQRVAALAPGTDPKLIDESIRRHAQRADHLWAKANGGGIHNDFVAQSVTHPDAIKTRDESHAAQIRATRYRRRVVVRYAKPHTRNFIDALRVSASENHRVGGVEAARSVARRMGIRDTHVLPAVHVGPGGATAGIAQAVYGAVRPESVDELASWLGLLMNNPGYAVHHVRPNGPDTLYRFRMEGSGLDIGEKLKRAGLTSAVMFHHKKGFDVMIPDKGNKLAPNVEALTRTHGLHVEASPGHFQTVGNTDPSAARATMRDKVVQGERPARRERRRGVRRYGRTIPATDPDMVNWWSQLTGRRRKYRLEAAYPGQDLSGFKPGGDMTGVSESVAAPFEDYLRENGDWRHWLLRGLAHHVTAQKVFGPVWDNYHRTYERPDRGRGGSIVPAKNEGGWEYQWIEHTGVPYPRGGTSNVAFTTDAGGAPAVVVHTVHPTKRGTGSLHSVLTPSEYAGMREEAGASGVSFPEPPTTHAATPERLSRTGTTGGRGSGGRGPGGVGVPSSPKRYGGSGESVPDLKVPVYYEGAAGTQLNFYAPLKVGGRWKWSHHSQDGYYGDAAAVKEVYPHALSWDEMFGKRDGGRGMDLTPEEVHIATDGREGTPPDPRDAERDLGRSNETTPEDFYAMTRREAVRRYAKVPLPEAGVLTPEQLAIAQNAYDNNDPTGWGALGDHLQENGFPHAGTVLSHVGTGQRGAQYVAGGGGRDNRPEGSFRYAVLRDGSRLIHRLHLKTHPGEEYHTFQWFQNPEPRPTEPTTMSRTPRRRVLQCR